MKYTYTYTHLVYKYHASSSRLYKCSMPAIAEAVAYLCQMSVHKVLILQSFFKMTILPILNNYVWYSWSHLQTSSSHYLGRVALIRGPLTLIKMIFSSLALNIMTFSIKIIKCDTQHNGSVAMASVVFAKCHYAECHYAECHYAECHFVECHYAVSLCSVLWCLIRWLIWTFWVSFFNKGTPILKMILKHLWEVLWLYQKIDLPIWWKIVCLRLPKLW